MSDDLPALAGSDDQESPQSGNVSVERYEATYRIGPLPTPEDLASYGDISPDLVFRIVDASDDERHHRHQMDAPNGQSASSPFDHGARRGFRNRDLVLGGFGMARQRRSRRRGHRLGHNRLGRIGRIGRIGRSVRHRP